jgi:phosphatidate phosphatase PAH1
MNGSASLSVTQSKHATDSDAFVSYINKMRKSPSHTPARLLKREKKREEEKKKREEKERKENVQDEIKCGRLLDFAIEDKFYLS